METIDRSCTAAGRSPLLAAILSLPAPGLGHVYAGRLARGVLLLASPLAVLPLSHLGARLEGAAGAVVGLVAPAGLLLLVWLFALVDAVRLARPGRASFALRAYNRPVVYVALLALGAGLPPGIALALRGTTFQVFETAASSMEPTLRPGDRFVANMHVLAERPPRRGEVVVWRPASGGGAYFAKRVIGLPGDVVAIRDGVPSVNGRPLARPAAEEGRSPWTESLDGRSWSVFPGDAELAPVTVPAGTCYVLGDHRAAALDSRAFGPVPLTELEGVGALLLWPWGARRCPGPIDAPAALPR